MLVRKPYLLEVGELVFIKLWGQMWANNKYVSEDI